ncbi:fucose isomerase [Microcella alkaliphila]|uniref:L-fucose isomerase family protein n=1 Tax=Microcella alkaliphila TaxID=279828 RepID=A0A0U4X0W5_9MICO|nr:fucose isomerase [Microcella alkaliphila]BAU33480.1 L-fucose isomerase family protein [Microcella alkaliphila]
MPNYTLPSAPARPKLEPTTAWLVASGDLREAPNKAGWPIQAAMEAELARVFADLGWTIKRAHPVDAETGHGFISSQRMGLEVFRNIPVDAPLVVAESVWQYSHHLLAGLRTHRGPILTVANFEGSAPGLVGLLGLNGGLTKMGTPYSTIWSVDFRDQWFIEGIRSWIESGTIEHDQRHVRALDALPENHEVALGRALAAQLQADKAIFGVFDEGCMGMYNAIIDDELMNPLGIYKERLSQSALWAEMLTVDEVEARAVLEWLLSRGMTFQFGRDEHSELTEHQVLMQARMYISLLRIADDFGLDAIGIQYQQGLKDICPASDLAEGLINNGDRPPVTSRDGSRVLWEGLPVPLANEADEGVAIDALVTHRIWQAMGLDSANTLHDVRWGEDYEGQFVWVFEISGSVPPSHFADGYAGATGWRQNPMYFPLGGSTIKGVSKAGEIVWSRVYIKGGSLHVDIGRGSAIDLPAEETERRWQATNPEWPIMHAVLHGVSRNQFMARHKANHVQVAYAPSAEVADRALAAKAAMFDALGVAVHLIGDAQIVR